MTIQSTRRKFIYQSMLAAAGTAAGQQAFAALYSGTASPKPVAAAGKPGEVKLCIFSKHLQWLGYQEMASTAAAMGFDGIDLTVRRNGHVEPERVAQDLPKAVKAAEQAGLKIYMLTTDITDATQPNTEAILKTASQLGIPYYRLGWMNYQTDISIEQNIEKYKRMFAQLAAYNKQYQLHGAYQNHAGTRLGSAIWDLWLILKDIDPDWLGCQYDIRHATIEGANTWPLTLQLLQQHIRTMDIKDFIWQHTDGKWQVQDVPLGEGMVDFAQYFKLLHTHQIKGPMSLHFEYPLGGANSGARTLTMPREQVLAAMQKDVTLLKSWLTKASLYAPATKGGK